MAQKAMKPAFWTGVKANWGQGIMHHRPRRHLILAALLLGLGCGGGQKSTQRAKAFAARTPPPGWVTKVAVKKDALCGIGVAGAGFPNSPYPKELARERSLRNLAGVLETQVQEAIIDRATTRGNSMRYARVLHVDDALIEQVGELAESDYWVDQAGEGPYAQESFTYAHSCIDADKAAGLFKLDPKALRGGGKGERTSPKKVPGWIGRHGKQPGGRLCAVGYSLPMFHPDKTFGAVVEDVRGQLSHVLRTLVSGYYEELSTQRSTFIEMMTVATTDAVSKGVIVTSYWYDRDGLGPYKTKRTTYGWGCVYPMKIIERTFADVAPKTPEDEKDAVAKVRERAENAFEDLDAEIDKREQGAKAPAPEPAPLTTHERDAPTPTWEDDAPIEPPVPLPAPPMQEGDAPTPAWENNAPVEPRAPPFPPPASIDEAQSSQEPTPP